jgi:hypothetical protein
MITRSLRTIFVAAALLGTATSLTGCHSQAVKRDLSPILGRWTIQGNVPEPDANMPRFTHLNFVHDGTLHATYVQASGALAGIIKSAPKMAQEDDTFTLVGQHQLRVIEGSRALEYHYDVRDDKLFMRPADAPTGESTVFVRVKDEDSSTDQSGSAAENNDGMSDPTPTPATDGN